jgi:DNA (cytosine-5)-methyltransferase 1
MTFTEPRKLRSRSDRFTAIDLFSGCGGLTLGLKQAGFNVVGAVEADAVAVNTYLANHRYVRVKHVDIRKLSARGFRRELRMRVGELDLLAGCPPCQGFSVLRTRNGSKRNRDHRNDLVHQMLRFAREFRPKAIMMENVPGLMGQRPLVNLCDGLRALGYVVTCAIKDAANYGVPQRRRRLILLAGRGFEPRFAKETRRIRSVRGAIGAMTEPGRSRDALHNLPEKKRAERIARLIRDIPRDGGSRTDLPKNRQLDCHRRSNGFGDIYGRMAWNKVAPTITSGCFNPSKGRFLHPEQDRAITMREAALLQTFPRRYVFDVSWGKEAIALMIGNALPPEFIRRHALEIQKDLTQRKSQSGKTHHGRHVLAQTAIGNHVESERLRKRGNRTPANRNFQSI